jgi:hypothetical protein
MNHTQNAFSFPNLYSQQPMPLPPPITVLLQFPNKISTCSNQIWQHLIIFVCPTHHLYLTMILNMCMFKIQIKKHLNQPVEKIFEQKLAVGQNFLSKNKSIEEEKKAYW